MSTHEYQGFEIEVTHEPEFGGWTAWVDDECLMRMRGGPRVHNSPTHALTAARRFIRALVARERRTDAALAATRALAVEG